MGSEKKIDEWCKCCLVCLQSAGKKEQIVVKDTLFGIKMNDPEKFYRIIFLRNTIFFIFPIRNCKFVISFNVQLPVHTVMRRGRPSDTDR